MFSIFRVISQKQLTLIQPTSVKAKQYTSKSWNPSLYENKHAYVWQYGEDLLSLLNPQPGEHILDLGCGTGQLTNKIASLGTKVIGIDNAPDMIEKAKQNYPHLCLEVGDAVNFSVNNPMDAVFSNAVLHWVKQAEEAVVSIKRALKPGGRFVAEFGGKGNVETIVKGIELALLQQGVNNPGVLNPWYFPSIGMYASLLEKHDFDVNFVNLFERPTVLEGEDGLASWITMFGGPFFVGMTTEQIQEIIRVVQEVVRPKLYKGGTWIADYRRIRVIAKKIHEWSWVSSTKTTVL